MTARAMWRRIETWLIVLIGIHSLVVGSMLVFAARWGLRFGGWGDVSPLFFAHQGGVFHFVVAFGYLWEFFRHRGIGLLLTAKTTAFVFLIVEFALFPVPWAVPVSGVLDLLMGLVVLLVHRQSAWSASDR